ncbi:TPA: hypothetical protein HA278_08665 [Candidatus Woesearchaeota archaeon]|jgi:hypothetical protein|nr:hypothetical protein [archaeon]HIJ12104.1 hypothetical protein [Candidatus Woesearchaeota archaeon]|tara:strand:+ start:81 stop:374 length:294 start_codon:yes stop_codon:yes gene_type:complete
MEKTFKAKSVVLSRKPGKDEEGMKSAFIGLFDSNNPHLHGKAPFDVLEVPDIEKIRIRDLRNVSYYLLGNDIVINNLEEVTFSKKDGIITVTGKQDL